MFGPDGKPKDVRKLNFLHQVPLPTDTAINILQQILMGLDFAHFKGLVHRDLKPENIMIMEEGEQLSVKILDLGIAHLEKRPTGKPGLGETASNAVDTRYFVGTRQYAAPEQFEIPARVAPKTDLFQVGILLAEMLTGRHPFSNDHEDKSGRNGHFEEWNTWIVEAQVNCSRNRDVELDAEMKTLLEGLLGRPRGLESVKEAWQALEFYQGAWRRPQTDMRCPVCDFAYTYYRAAGANGGSKRERLVVCPKCGRQYIDFRVASS